MLIFGTALGLVLPVSLGLGFAVVQGARVAQSVATNVNLTIQSVNAPDNQDKRNALLREGRENAWLKIRDYIVEQERRRLERLREQEKLLEAREAGAGAATGAAPAPAEAGDEDAHPNARSEADSTPPSESVLPAGSAEASTDPVRDESEHFAPDAQSGEPADPQDVDAHVPSIPLIEFGSTPSVPAPSEIYQVGLWGLNWLSQNAAAIGRQVLNASGGAFEAAVTVFTKLFALGFGGFLTAFFFFFFCTGYGEVLDFWESLIPERKKGRVIDLLAQMDVVIAAFVRGRLTICAILILYYIVAYWLVGVPAPLIVGLIVGLLTLVPYAAGATTPIVMLVMWLGQTGNEGWRAEWWWIVGGPILASGVQQVFDDYFLTPRIQGKSTNMGSPTILFASIAGGAIAGFYGLLLAIPVAACLKILLREIFWPRVREWLAGKVADPLPIEER
jgi:predicted PurR-regulated permease PerM